MNVFWQRLIIFFLIGLPITWENVKTYWYAVVAWIIFLIIINYFLFDFLKNLYYSLDLLQ
jgi:hypothetical protein